MKRIIFDFETRSCCDLKKSGAYKYSLDPATQPTCLAFKIRGQPKVYFLDFEMVNRKWSKLPNDLKDLWQSFINEGFEFTAHNAFFERCIYTNILVERYGWPMIPFRRYRCTAAKAAACALPRNLEGAGEAMGLSVQKDKRGYVAMMATCKPTRRSNDFYKMRKAIEDRLNAGKSLTPKQQKWRENRANFTEPKKFLDPQDDPKIWDTLYTYCKIDVKAEEALDIALPDLIPEEQEIWFLNQKLNWRGLYVDVPTIDKIVKMMETESADKLKELDKLTMGLVTKPGARKSILDFLALEGIELPDIKAKTVDDFLKNGELSEDGRRLLEIRKALSKTSTRKYQAFMARANSDNRVRDILLYHGASTGRDTGTGVQPHNFPRGILRVDKSRPYAHVENVVECDPELLRLLYGESLGPLFSSILRNMILPSPGKTLFVADFSKIEVAVLWWLAGNVAGLEVLKSGKDPYKYMAAANTNKDYYDIEDEGDERQLGKAQVLGCGFGMGPDKFQTTAWDQYRLKLTLKAAKRAVENYREANAPVTWLWRDYEKAAIRATEEDVKIKVGKCKFFRKDKFLWVELPSGRRLAYKDPRVVWRQREIDAEETLFVNGKFVTFKTKKLLPPQKTLEFMAVNSKTKKWALERTWGGTLTENIVQAVARDLMMQASVRLDKSGYKFLLSVHDEGLTEKTTGEGTVEEFTKIMLERPKWADAELPLDAKGWEGPRYRK